MGDVAVILMEQFQTRSMIDTLSSSREIALVWMP